MHQTDTALHSDSFSIEGSLFTAEWLAKVAAQQAPAQTDADYDVRAGFNVREEIGLAWRSAQSLWRQFSLARQQPGHDPWGVTQRFSTELLRQCFAFQLVQHTVPQVQAERHYPVPFSAFAGRVPIVVSLHDEARPLDTAQDRLGDNSGERIRRRSAFGLLQESLNAQSDALWGIATNGLLLRVARDNASLTRPAWVEVDLERLFSEERYADFSVLWLLLHATRFGSEGGVSTDCALEQWRNACREQGTRARETLRVGVEHALLTLGQGFVSHPANTALREALASGAFSPQDYLRELLRLVYRQIFLLTIEERGILHRSDADPAATGLYATGYGLRRLRERAVRRSAHDRHADLWQGLKQVWLGLSVGEPLLALPPLGGLFETTQCLMLDACRLENRHLLLALFHLAWLRADGHAPLTRVNWRDMGPEELGSIYESLLELVPQLSHEHRQFSFQTGAATRGNARKTTGSYYTADPLVQEQLDSALEPVVAAILAAHPLGEDAVRALLAISVIDPACGSGHFLLAAARRLAGHLARVRAQMRDALLGHGGQPTPDDYRHALRDVVTHCLYGVDMNPMALELARMALWLEAYTPDAPLGFIDHHFRLGNALLGVMDPKTLLDGVPDEAYKELTGDDKGLCRDLKKRNKKEREGLLRMLAAAQLSQSMHSMDLAITAAPLQQLDALPDATLADIAAKRQAWGALQQGAATDGLALAMDLYCAAFLLPKHGTEQSTAVPTTQDVMNALLGQPVAPAKRAAALQLAETTPLLHWRLGFAQVFARGGFTVVLANPPWERLKLQEEEYFAARAPAIAAAAKKAEREQAIAALAAYPLGSPERRIHDDFTIAKHRAEAGSLFCHGPRYPLTGTGDVNSYALFAETSLQILHPHGHAGLVLPTGIATDDTTKLFFAELVNSKRLISVLSFWEIRRFFPDSDSRDPFCLFTIGASEVSTFVFQAQRVLDLRDTRRRFELTRDDIFRLSPNTRNCPVFRSREDAILIMRIASNNPVLKTNSAADSGWDVRLRRMFDVSADSKKLVARDDPRWQPELMNVQEGELGHQFNHRAIRYEGEVAVLNSDDWLSNVDAVASPPIYCARSDFLEKIRSMGADQNPSQSAFLGFRRVARSTDERTVIACIFPWQPSTYGWILTLGTTASENIILCGMYNSLVFDYLMRAKLSQGSIPQGTFEQVHIVSKNRFSSESAEDVGRRVLQLIYSARDLQPFYEDVVAENPNWDPRIGPERGQPWRWNPERRALLRAELDAIYARLYGLTRDELRYILDPADVMGADYPSETFRVLKDKEIRLHGEYRTRRLVLGAWDRLENTPWQ